MHFPYELFVLSYVNVTLVSVFKSVLSLCLRLRTTWLDRPICFTHANVLLSYVYENIFAWKLPLLQDSCQSFYGPLTLCQCYLKMHAVGEGPSASLWVLRHFLSPISRMLEALCHGRRSLVGCSPWGHWESDKTERVHFHFSLSSIGEGNGNPLQCSCLENPRDGGSWWAAVYGVAQTWIWLKWLSSSSSRSSYITSG